MNRTIINFLVSCPQGTMFLKLVDASDKVKDANLLFQLLDEIVMLVEEANVVHIIIDNASNYVLASKMLESKYKTIFWTPCANEAMDQAKEQIKATYKDRVAKYGPIWEIIDNRWNNQLHCPIHAVGYFLNPRYHYRAQVRRRSNWGGQRWIV
jgi:hypothetical protein